MPKDFIEAESEERILFCGWRRDMEDMIMVILQEFMLPLIQSRSVQEIYLVLDKSGNIFR